MVSLVTEVIVIQCQGMVCMVSLVTVVVVFRYFMIV